MRLIQTFPTPWPGRHRWLLIGCLEYFCIAWLLGKGRGVVQWDLRGAMEISFASWWILSSLRLRCDLPIQSTRFPWERGVEGSGHSPRDRSGLKSQGPSELSNPGKGAMANNQSENQWVQIYFAVFSSRVSLVFFFCLGPIFYRIFSRNRILRQRRLWALGALRMRTCSERPSLN